MLTFKKLIISNFILYLLLISFVGHAKLSLLQSGPMIGYTEMKEVMLWVQTNNAASVHYEYWEKNTINKKYKTEPIKAVKENAFIVKAIVTELEPGKEYEYRLYINNKIIKRPYPLEFKTQHHFQYRYDAPDFSFAIGSCNYVNDSLYDRPGKSYGGGYTIYESIRKHKPDFMIWGGDNVYLREADWTTKSGIFYRYTHTRSLPEMQPLLGSIAHYAIWDDHDYGSNDADRSFMNKSFTTEAFKLFWANQHYGQSKDKGIYSTFTYHDVQFFLLDNRTFRSPNNRVNGYKEYLGNTQLDWLLDGLSSSKATLKIIVNGGQIINPAEIYENYSNYGTERELLLNSIEKEKITGVFFISGDRHHTELTKLNRDSTYPLYDLTVSPLTSGVYTPKKDENNLQVEETLVSERNFGIVKISGKKANRTVTITICNSNGEQLWTKEISENILK